MNFSIFYSFHLFYFVFFVCFGGISTWVLGIECYHPWYSLISDTLDSEEWLAVAIGIKNISRWLAMPGKGFFWFSYWLFMYYYFLLFVSSFVIFVIVFYLKAHYIIFFPFNCSLLVVFYLNISSDIFLFYFVWSLCFKIHFMKYVEQCSILEKLLLNRWRERRAHSELINTQIHFILWLFFCWIIVSFFISHF